MEINYKNILEKSEGEWLGVPKTQRQCPGEEALGPSVKEGRHRPDWVLYGGAWEMAIANLLGRRHIRAVWLNGGKWKEVPTETKQHQAKPIQSWRGCHRSCSSAEGTPRQTGVRGPDSLWRCTLLCNRQSRWQTQHRKLSQVPAHSGCSPSVTLSSYMVLDFKKFFRFNYFI